MSKIAEDLARMIAAQEKRQAVQDAIKRATEQAKAVSQASKVSPPKPKG